MKRSSLQNEWVKLKKIDGFFIGSAPKLTECFISNATGARRCFPNVTFGHSNILAGHVRTYFCLEKFSVQSCECVSRGFNSKRNWLLKSLIAGNRCVSLTKKTFQERECERGCESERESEKVTKRGDENEMYIYFWLADTRSNCPSLTKYSLCSIPSTFRVNSIGVVGYSLQASASVAIFTTL
jgi:hypothetical protein